MHSETHPKQTPHHCQRNVVPAKKSKRLEVILSSKLGFSQQTFNFYTSKLEISGGFGCPNPSSFPKRPKNANPNPTAVVVMSFSAPKRPTSRKRTSSPRPHRTLIFQRRHRIQPELSTWLGLSKRKRWKLSGTLKLDPVTKHFAISPIAGPNLKPSPAKPQTWQESGGWKRNLKKQGMYVLN